MAIKSGVKPNPEVIDTITRYPIPQTQKADKAFLGRVNYDWKLIKDSVILTNPILQYLKKNAKFGLTDKYRKLFKAALENLKKEPKFAIFGLWRKKLS